MDRYFELIDKIKVLSSQLPLRQAQEIHLLMNHLPNMKILSENLKMIFEIIFDLKISLKYI